MAQADISQDCNKEGKAPDQSIYSGALMQFLKLKPKFFICQICPCMHTDVYTFLMHYNSCDFKAIQIIYKTFSHEFLTSNSPDKWKSQSNF